MHAWELPHPLLSALSQISYWYSSESEIDCIWTSANHEVKAMEQTTWNAIIKYLWQGKFLYKSLLYLNLPSTWSNFVLTTKGNLLPLKSFTILISNGITHYHGRLTDCVAWLNIQVFFSFFCMALWLWRGLVLQSTCNWPRIDTTIQSLQRLLSATFCFMPQTWTKDGVVGCSKVVCPVKDESGLKTWPACWQVCCPAKDARGLKARPACSSDGIILLMAGAPRQSSGKKFMSRGYDSYL